MKMETEGGDLLLLFKGAKSVCHLHGTSDPYREEEMVLQVFNWLQAELLVVRGDLG
jgi:hypothetical protein